MWSLAGSTYPYCDSIKVMRVSKKYLRGKR